MKFYAFWFIFLQNSDVAKFHWSLGNQITSLYNLDQLLKSHSDLKCPLHEDDLFEVPSILEQLVRGLEPHWWWHLFEAFFGLTQDFDRSPQDHHDLDVVSLKLTRAELWDVVKLDLKLINLRLSIYHVLVSEGDEHGVILFVFWRTLPLSKIKMTVRTLIHSRRNFPYFSDPR